jgi:hypothetical protein
VLKRSDVLDVQLPHAQRTVLAELAREIATNSPVRVDRRAWKEVVKRLLLDGINGNRVLAPSRKMRSAMNIRPHPTTPKLARRDDALVLTGKALKIAVGKRTQKRRLLRSRHLKSGN